MVGKTGFEPATTRSQTECSTKLSHFPINGVPKRSRTPNLLIRSQTLYPVELWGQPVQNIYKLRLAFKNGGFSWNRTNDTKIFSLVLCQLSYEATMAVPTGIEPAIPRVTGECDNRYTTEPYFWLQEKDLNLRPLGYEPNELPTAPLRDVIVLWVQRYGFLFNMQIKCMIFLRLSGF